MTRYVPPTYTSFTFQSTSVPRPTSTFEPISPQQLTNSTENHTESSPQSSLLCGQRTPMHDPGSRNCAMFVHYICMQYQ